MNAFISVLACSPGSVPKAGHLSRARIARQRDGGVGTAVALNRLIFKPTEVDRNGTVVLPQEDYRSAHVREVLRLPREGGTIRGGVADQYLVNDVPVSIEGDRGVSFHLASGVQQELPEAPHISLILAVPRPKVLARLLPQIVAIGVRNIVLCNAYKVEKCYFDSFLLRDPEEMESLLIEGISQSGVDSRLPTVAVERRLKVFLEDRLSTVAPEQSQLLLAEPGSDLTVFETLRRSSTKPSAKRNGKPRGIEHIVLAVGPEGGWMPREASMFEEMFGFQRVSLGDRILRTDAAVLILLGLLHEFIRVAESDSSTLRHDELKDNISQTF